MAFTGYALGADGGIEGIDGHEGGALGPAFDSELFVIDVLTRELTRITDNGQDDFMPSWAADGSSLLFASGEDGVDEDIWMMPIAAPDEAMNLIDDNAGVRKDDNMVDFRSAGARCDWRRPRERVFVRDSSHPDSGHLEDALAAGRLERAGKRFGGPGHGHFPLRLGLVPGWSEHCVAPHVSLGHRHLGSHRARVARCSSGIRCRLDRRPHSHRRWDFHSLQRRSHLVSGRQTPGVLGAGRSGQLAHLGHRPLGRSTTLAHARARCLAFYPSCSPVEVDQLAYVSEAGDGAQQLWVAELGPGTPARARNLTQGLLEGIEAPLVARRLPPGRLREREGRRARQRSGTPHLPDRRGELEDHAHDARSAHRSASAVVA